MVTFRDNKQALYGIFQYVCATTNPLQNSMTTTVQPNLLQMLEGAK